MKSSKAKILHEIAGRPMVLHALDSISDLKAQKKIVVISPDMDEVGQVITGEDSLVEIVFQKKPLGTGHAVASAREAVAGFSGNIIVLFGDTPLMSADTLVHFNELMQTHDVGVIGFKANDPTGYGRLIQNSEGYPIAIREHKDASPAELEIDFCNSGILAMASKDFPTLIDSLSNDNAKSEYYLTDVVEIATSLGLKVGAIECSEEEVQGINTQEQLSCAETVYQNRARSHAMANGVQMTAPSTVFFSYDTILEADVVIEPNVVFGPGVHVSSGACIRAFCHIEGASIGENAVVGPYARLRPGTVLSHEVKVGNFVEIKNAQVHKGAKINHLSYVGDAKVGAGANIGAGTITCNYDGYNKHLTEIGEGAFIGSNSSLVAPVRIGKGAYVGSGSVITKEIEPDALAVGRGRQKNMEGWAQAYRSRNVKSKTAAKD
jgi:bifunctional UDP-N-acetylglucosamine pyrophosphorylase / glucosamine-1-phosphate N-acetyltransferase